jgi:hypothetical protein
VLFKVCEERQIKFSGHVRFAWVVEKYSAKKKGSVCESRQSHQRRSGFAAVNNARISAEDLAGAPEVIRRLSGASNHESGRRFFA